MNCMHTLLAILPQGTDKLWHHRNFCRCWLCSYIISLICVLTFNEEKLASIRWHTYHDISNTTQKRWVYVQVKIIHSKPGLKAELKIFNLVSVKGLPFYICKMMSSWPKFKYCMFFTRNTLENSIFKVLQPV